MPIRHRKVTRHRKIHSSMIEHQVFYRDCNFGMGRRIFHIERKEDHSVPYKELVINFLFFRLKYVRTMKTFCYPFDMDHMLSFKETLGLRIYKEK